MQWAESCREAELPGGNTHYHKGAARQGSPLGEEEVQGEVGDKKGTIPWPLLPVSPTHIHTMTGKGEIMCAEPILHCCQGECGMSQEVVTGTPGEERRGHQPSKACWTAGAELSSPALLLG